MKFKNLNIGTKIVSGYIFLILVFIITVAIVLFSLNGLTADFRFLVEHDQPVLANAALLEKLVVDMETGERGFLITGEEVFLEPYNAGLAQFSNLMATEKELVSDNPPQVALLEEIEQLHNRWLQNAAEPAILLRYEVNKATVNASFLQEVLREGVGKGILDELRVVLDEIESNLRAKDDLESVILVVKIEKAMVDQETGERGFLITGDDKFLEPYYAGQANLTAHLQDLEQRLTNDARNLARLNQVETLAANWIEQAATPEINARLEMNANPTTMEDVGVFIQSGLGKSILDQIRGKFATFVQTENELNLQRVADAESQATLIYILTISLTVVAIVIGLVVGIGISRAITGPMSQVVDAAERIQAGDLSQKVDISSKDEVGTLAAVFNEMITNLRDRIEQEAKLRLIEQEANKNAVAKETIEQVVNDYNQFIERVASGDLTSRLTVNGNNGSQDLSMLGHNLNAMVESLGNLANQIREATNSITSAASEILAATTQQAAGANEQSAAISQTTTTIDEVKAIVEQSFNKAQEVAQQSQQTQQISSQGESAVQDTMESMHQIKERVEGIAENILALSEKTQQIGEITATVNEIASQSNLLALNASVEAARAGEHGKGFAVVAVEVRNLAEQSKQATAQVKTILNEIQQATNAAVMATEEGTKGVDSGVRLTEQTGSTIQELANGMNTNVRVALQIVASAQQQTTGMEQIALAMQNIEQATLQNLSSTQQAENAAQNLANVAHEMESLVARYKL